MSSSGNYLFSSESVTEGHPDKIADQISDAILDEVLKQDPKGRVACESLVATGMALLSGEITTEARVDYPAVARDVLARIGYTDARYGISAEHCSILNVINRQSPDIACGVDTGGAGDQGLMFGFACRETEQLMPMPIMLAHAVTRRLAEARREVDGSGNRRVPWLRPDGKSQVTVEYEGQEPRRVHTLVVSTQHDDTVSQDEIRATVIDEVVRQAIPESMIDNDTIFHVNPTGRFVIGGPHGDCGLTGRKIIVDTYGGVGHHGGGAFSGKDSTKVDRSASYMARHIAKNLVAAGLADRLEIQIAYAIGVADPVSVHVDSFGTGKVDEKTAGQLVRDLFPLQPRGIIEYLDLQKPVFLPTAAYGHFGREEDGFTWESTHRAQDIRSAAGI